MSIELQKSRVLLTGASGGIGVAIARSLHGRGAVVVLTGRQVEVLEGLRAELGDRAEVVAADLSEVEDVERLIEGAGQVDVLVANAALPGTGRLESFSRDEIDTTLDVNLRAPIQLARALVPGMMERGEGHLVLINSGAGKIPLPLHSVYSATKFGLRGFGFALREDLRGSGVGVTVIFPGMIRDAGMFARSGVKAPKGVATRSPEQVAEAVIAGIEKDKASIDVAPFAARAGGRLFGLAPSVVTAANRRMGMKKAGSAMAKAHQDRS